MEKYARRCDVTQEGMNHGYCILDGWMYIKYEKDMLQHITDETDYNDIEEAYKSDYFYYTDWFDTIEEEDEWYTEDGRLIVNIIMKTMYKVVTVDEFGLPVTQEDGFKTSAEAQQEAKECIERWGEQFGQDFWVEPYEQQPYKEPRTYNNNAVDGWEDLYPLDENQD